MRLACYFTVFMILKTAFQNISKTLSQNFFKLCHNEGNYGRYILLKAISSKTLLEQRNTKINEKRNGVIMLPWRLRLR